MISRRDTILMTVLINLGIVGILLVTAITDHEEDLSLSSQAIIHEVTQMVPSSVSMETAHEIKPKPLVDEVDHAIATYIEEKPSPVIEEDPSTVTVKVKRGDTLEKIARVNGVSMNDIRDLNGLKTDNLKIGQVLKMPISGKVLPEPVRQSSSSSSAGEPGVYVTVEKGDNPWKIARRYNVSYTQILRLNDLDETSAKNLKVGDKIRVK